MTIVLFSDFLFKIKENSLISNSHTPHLIHVEKDSVYIHLLLILFGVASLFTWKRTLYTFISSLPKNYQSYVLV